MHMMIQGGDDCVLPGVGLEASLDFVGVAFHGMATTHIDALCHVFVDGQMYNGFAAIEVKSTGARRGSIMCARDGITSRGVLLDVPHTLGVDWIEAKDAITVAQPKRPRAQGVRVTEGDILIVAMVAMRGGRNTARGSDGRRTAGMHPNASVDSRSRRRGARLRRRLDIAEHRHPRLGDADPQCALVAMGVHLLDNLRLVGSAKRARSRTAGRFCSPLRRCDRTRDRLACESDRAAVRPIA
jgi:hypothetical protein